MTDRTPATDVDAFDIREPLRRLRRVVGQHSLILMGTCAVTVAGVVLFIKLRPPVYQASVTVLSEASTDKGRDSFYDKWNIFRKDDVQSEPQLLAGGSVLALTMEKLDMGWGDVHHGVGSQLGHWWSLSPIGKEYRKIKERFFPRPKTDWDMTQEQREKILALIDFKSAVNFQGVNESLVGSLSVRGPTKQVAEIANTIVESYIELRADRHVHEAQLAYDVLTEQVAESLERLLDLELEVQVFRDENEIFLDFEEERTKVAHWAQMEMEMVLDSAKLIRARAELVVVEEQLASEPSERMSGSTSERNAIDETLEADLLRYELTLVDALHRFNPDAPEVRELEDTMEAIKARLEATADMVLASEASSRNQTYDKLRDKRNDLVALIASLEQSEAFMEQQHGLHKRTLVSLPSEQRQLQALVRKAQLADSEYRVLVDKQISARVSIVAARATTPSIRIIDIAVAPDSPVWPKTKYMLGGAVMVGLLLGVAAAWLRDALDSRVRRHHLVGGRGAAPLLGSVRMMGGDKVRPRPQGGDGS